MPEEKELPAENQITDISDKDMEKVKKFMADGLPGIAKLEENQFQRSTEMYMAGSTYHQISNATGIPRAAVLYLSHTFGWYLARREYLWELQEKVKSRIIDSKLESKDFLLLYIQASQKRIGKSLKKYLATDDEKHADEIDLKEVSQLLKTIEVLQGLDSEGKDSRGKTPAVGLNFPDGVTIERSGDNKLTISPKEKTVGDMLKKFADKRREEQNKTKESSDIIDVSNNNNEESKNEKE